MMWKSLAISCILCTARAQDDKHSAEIVDSASKHLSPLGDQHNILLRATSDNFDAPVNDKFKVATRALIKSSDHLVPFQPVKASVSDVLTSHDLSNMMGDSAGNNRASAAISALDISSSSKSLTPIKRRQKVQTVAEQAKQVLSEAATKDLNLIRVQLPPAEVESDDEAYYNADDYTKITGLNEIIDYADLDKDVDRGAFQDMIRNKENELMLPVPDLASEEHVREIRAAFASALARHAAHTAFIADVFVKQQEALRAKVPAQEFAAQNIEQKAAIAQAFDEMQKDEELLLGRSYIIHVDDTTMRESSLDDDHLNGDDSEDADPYPTGLARSKHVKNETESLDDSYYGLATGPKVNLAAITEHYAYYPDDAEFEGYTYTPYSNDENGNGSPNTIKEPPMQIPVRVKIPGDMTTNQITKTENTPAVLNTKTNDNPIHNDMATVSEMEMASNHIDDDKFTDPTVGEKKSEEESDDYYIVPPNIIPPPHLEDYQEKLGRTENENSRNYHGIYKPENGEVVTKKSGILHNIRENVPGKDLAEHSPADIFSSHITRSINLNQFLEYLEGGLFKGQSPLLPPPSSSSRTTSSSNLASTSSSKLSCGYLRGTVINYNSQNDVDASSLSPPLSSSSLSAPNHDHSSGELENINESASDLTKNKEALNTLSASLSTLPLTRDPALASPPSFRSRSLLSSPLLPPFLPSSLSSYLTTSRRLSEGQVESKSEPTQVEEIKSRKLQVQKSYMSENEDEPQDADVGTNDTELPIASFFRAYFSPTPEEPLISVPKKKAKVVKAKAKVSAKSAAVKSVENGKMKESVKYGKKADVAKSISAMSIDNFTDTANKIKTQNRNDENVMSKKQIIMDIKKSRNRNLKNDKKIHKLQKGDVNDFYANKISNKMEKFTNLVLAEKLADDVHSDSEESRIENITSAKSDGNAQKEILI